MSKIATEQEAAKVNIIIPDGADSDMRCCTKSKAVDEFGCKILGTYADNQLVQLDDVKYGINYITITVNDNQTVTAKPKFYHNIPAETIQNMIITVRFRSNNYMLRFASYNWDDTLKEWTQYTANQQPGDQIVVSDSTLSIQSDTEHEYAFAPVPKDQIFFRLISSNYYFMLAFMPRLQINAGQYINQVLSTTHGDFTMPYDIHYYSLEKKLMDSTFDELAVEVLQLPEHTEYEFIEDKEMPIPTFYFEVENLTSESSWHGSMKFIYGTGMSYSGIIETQSVIQPCDWNADILVTYQASDTSRKWKIRNFSTGVEYILEHGVERYIGNIDENTKFQAVQYI